MIRFVHGFCGALLLSTGAVSAQEMTFKTVSNGGNCYVGCSWTLASGVITADTPAVFEAFIATNFAAPVVFNSPGGDLAAAMQLGRAIREHDLDTMVGTSKSYSNSWHEPEAGAECIGACAVAFLGGTERTIGMVTFNFSFDGLLAFDRVAAEEIYGSIEEAAFTGEDRLLEQAEIGAFISYLLDMGVSPDFYARLAALRPGKTFSPQGPEAEALSIATVSSSVADWRLVMNGPGLSIATGPRGATDGFAAYCTAGKPGMTLVRTYAKTALNYEETQELPCWGDFCLPGPIETVFPDGLNVSFGDASGGSDGKGQAPVAAHRITPGSSPGVALRIEFDIGSALWGDLIGSQYVSFTPTAESRVSFSNASVLDFLWEEGPSAAQIALVERNCTR